MRPWKIKLVNRLDCFLDPGIMPSCVCLALEYSLNSDTIYGDTFSIKNYETNDVRCFMAKK